ncbi:NADH:ubiquinone oxidoreductase subunit M [Gimesia panareensis]|uniref:NADH:ubiquinone oxidoreductase subunit M n=1 Tax=Gimesia panareensis TaxID=2527978 RepID=A0A518FQ45_9PLAN|nr:hypothetical protein [Gimesia panareensis]QDV18468.1 NADH:ubiquinone oxidoreductase subunit M [Gimesia panareensis]
MDSFLNSLIAFSPVLLVVMPVAGACFGLGSAKLGLEFNRWTTFSNTLVSCLILTLVLFAPEIQGTGPTRIISITLKLPVLSTAGPDAATPRNFQWGLDALSAWFLLLITCLWPMLVYFSDRLMKVSWLHYFLLLILQAMLAGLLISHDVISFVTFLFLTTVCTLCLLRIWNGSRAKSVFESTMYLQFLGDTLILTGLVLATTSFSWMQGVLLEAPQPLTFQFDALFRESMSDVSLYPLAEAYWSTSAPWILLTLLAGFAIKGFLFPAYYGMSQWLSLQKERTVSPSVMSGWSLILLTVISKMSLYGMLRCLVPLQQSVSGSLYSLLAFWGMIGFLISALLVCVRRDLLQVVVWFLVGQAALTFTILSAAEEVVSYFALLNVIQGLAAGTLLLVIPFLTPESEYKADRVLRWLGWLSLLTLIGAPGLGGFTAFFAFLWSLTDQHLLLALGYLLGTLLFNLALIRGGWQLLRPSDSTAAITDTKTAPAEKRALVWLAVGPTVLLIVSLGITPAYLLERTLFPLVSFQAAPVAEAASEE